MLRTYCSALSCIHTTVWLRRLTFPNFGLLCLRLREEILRGSGHKMTCPGWWWWWWWWRRRRCWLLRLQCCAKITCTRSNERFLAIVPDWLLPRTGRKRPDEVAAESNGRKSAGKSYVNCRHHNRLSARFLVDCCQSHIRRPSVHRRPHRTGPDRLGSPRTGPARSVTAATVTNASLPGASVKCIIDAPLHQHSEPLNNLSAPADKSPSESGARVTVSGVDGEVNWTDRLRSVLALDAPERERLWLLFIPSLPSIP